MSEQERTARLEASQATRDRRRDVFESKGQPSESKPKRSRSKASGSKSGETSSTPDSGQ